MAESKLAKFVEDIIIPPRMIDIIVDGEVFFLLVIVDFLSVLDIMCLSVVSSATNADVVDFFFRLVKNTRGLLRL